VAAGESSFQKPSITIWQDQKLVTSLKAHKYGVEAVKFTYNSEHLVSLGHHQNDKGLIVWHWRTGQKFSMNKLSKPVISLAMGKDFFITCGFQHLKFWYLDAQT
jgi:WD40 repeat protein